MRTFAAVLLLATLAAAPASALGARPVSGKPLLAIDKRAGFRNFLPTRMLPGFAYESWSYSARSGLRVSFRDKAGRRVRWLVEPMAASPSCGPGEKTFQLAGNKVWWMQRSEGGQIAWRCVFGQDGKPLRLAAETATPPTKLAGAGLGMVVASGKRY
jgi:hypothetical protein